MFLHQRIIGTLLGFSIFLIIFILIRKKRISEARAAAWLISGFIIFVVSASRGIQLFLGKIVGSKNTPATILALGVLFLFVICLDLAVQVSLLNKRVHDLMQEFAILGGLERDSKAEHDEHRL